MARSIRYFKCPDRQCNATTAFDLSKIIKPETNFVICGTCEKKFDVTIIPSCCTISLLFINSNGIGKKRLTSIQHFKK